MRERKSRGFFGQSGWKGRSGKPRARCVRQLRYWKLEGRDRAKGANGTALKNVSMKGATLRALRAFSLSLSTSPLAPQNPTRLAIS